jgi:hypothetical protein
LHIKFQTKKNVDLLEAGTYFAAAINSTHKITIKDNQEAIIYIRTNGKFEVTSKTIITL